MIPSTRPSSLRGGLMAMVIGIGLLASAQQAAAQATYDFVGVPFTLFSCGPNTSGGVTLCTTSGPNGNTSYESGDRVSARITLDDPLEANLPLTNIASRAGFQLTMNDGQQSVASPISSGQALVAEVATDSNGNIANWNVFINTGGANNGGVFTQHYQHPTISACCHGDGGTLLGVPPGDSARYIANPNAGVWTTGGGTPTPSQAVESLLSMVGDPLLLLTGGQVNSLSDKLSNALASIEAGLNKQAINQLNAFISAVQAEVKKGKMDSGTGALLINEANAVKAALAA